MNTRFLLAWACTLFLMFFALLDSSLAAQAQQKADNQSVQKPLIQLTEKEALAFFQWVMNLMNVEHEANKQLPPWTKERISWFFRQNQEDQLTLSVIATGLIGDDQQVIAMASGYKDGKANIEVNLSLLAIWFWDSYKQNVPVNRARRNDLALILSHEVIHIQHGSVILQEITVDPALRKEEERRTWAVSVLEDIRPLIRKGEKMNDHFIKAEEAFRFCNGDPDCPAFEKFVDGHTKKEK